MSKKVSTAIRICRHTVYFLKQNLTQKKTLVAWNRIHLQKICIWVKIMWPFQCYQSGGEGRGKRGFTTKNLENFPTFSDFISPRIETPQNNITSVHSLLAQSGSTEAHKHFLFHFFTRRWPIFFLAFQKAPDLEHILIKCQKRNLQIIQKAFFFLSNLGIYIETVLCEWNYKTAQSHKGKSTFQSLKEFCREGSVLEDAGVTRDIYRAQPLRCFHNHYQQFCEAWIFLFLVL